MGEKQGKTRGELALILSGEEAVALERAIQAYTSNTGSSDVPLLKSVQRKLNEAKDKML